MFLRPFSCWLSCWHRTDDPERRA